ncbi:MAG: cytochrome c-type biosis protein CcmH [Actinomycetota bacterium]|nr:cytochrome c-type biosis protein CcmH [Actinomycetota bacterium]
MKRVLAFLLLALAMVVALGSSAIAAPEDVANSIATQVMSPYCPGVTLHDCPSDAAVKLRERITSWAEQGWDRDRIIAKLKDEFGPGIVAAPPKSGSGLFAWLLPLAAVLIGALLLWRLLARWTHPPEDGPPASVSAEDHRRVEAEMAKFRTSG